MCLFKKKTKIEINSKYKLGQKVFFKYKGDVTAAYIYSVKETEDGIIYSLQIGGECPAIIENIKENNIFLMK